MYYYFLAIILALLYTLYYVFVKKLLNFFSIKEIIILAYLFCGILITIFYLEQINVLIKKINLHKFIWLILFALLLITTNMFGILSCDSTINIGKIESLASVIYLPLVAIISFLFYKNNNKLTKINFIGILFVALGGYLLI